MKNIYKFLIIIVTVLFFGILSIYFIPSHKNFVVFKIKQKIPSSIKTKLKDTLFIIPEQKRKIEFYQKKYNNLEVEYKDGYVEENVMLPIGLNFFWPDASV